MNKKLNIINDCTGMYDNEIIETIMQSREIDDVDNFLDPTLENYMLPLGDLKNIDKAVSIILNGLKNGDLFGVYADVDLDGVSATSIMVNYLRTLGIEPIVYCNKGKEHGVNNYNLNKILEDQINILIIVDSLDRTIDNYKILKENNINTLVLDHHSIDPEIPYSDYITLVSSQNDYENPNLCGAGVTWKVTVALDEAIGTYESANLLSLAMAGTCGDMMDLSKNSMENRAIVNEGLKNVTSEALQRIGGGFEWNSKTISFGVAPKVNSCMRMSKNEYALNAFLSDDEKEMKKYVKLLSKCKDEQNAEIDKLYDDAIEQCERQKDNNAIYVIIETDLGIAGLLCNKLMYVYKKPVFCLKEEKYGYSGSCRSVGCGNFLEICNNTGLGKFAGHDEAFGVVSIKYDDFNVFRQIIEEQLSEIEFSTEIDIDAQINIGDVNNNLIDMIKSIDRISGMNFPSLCFLIEIDDYHVEKVSKDKHLCIRTDNMLFIKWNFNDDELYKRLEEAELFQEPIRCWGNLDGSFVYGTYNKMILDDFEIVE